MAPNMNGDSPDPQHRPSPLDFYGDEQRIAAIFKWFLGLALAALLAGALILSLSGNVVSAVAMGVSTLPVLAGIHLARRKKYESAAILLALVMLTVMTWLASRGQGVHNINILGFPAILIIVSLVARKRALFLLTAFSIACVAWLVFGDIYGLYEPNPFTHSVTGDFFSVSLALILTAVMVRLVVEALFQSNRRLQKELVERQQIETALAFSEKRFHQAFHSSPVMMTIETDRRFVDVNQAFCDIMGYAYEEAVGRKASELNLWAFDEDIQKIVKLTEERREIRNLELRFRSKSGEIGAALVSNDHFEINGTRYELTSALDITDRKQAETDLHQRETILNAVAAFAERLFKASDWRSEVDDMLESLGKSIGASHAYLFQNTKLEDGRLTTSILFEWTMPGFESDLGNPRYIQSPLGEDDLESWHQNMSRGLPYIGDRKRLNDDDYQFILGRGMKALLDVPIFIDGFWWGCIGFDDAARERAWTNAEVDGLVAAANVLAGAIQRSQIDAALQAELGERKRMQDVLFEEKERAEVTLHSIGDAVITTDVHATVEYFNPAAEILTGWSMEEAQGQPLRAVFRIINEDTRLPVVNPVERCLREGKVVGLANHSILVSRGGREHSINDSAAPIRNRRGDVIGAVLVFQDVTVERRLSRQVAHDAAHDSLTGLINRREFERRLERALINTRERGLSHILCYLDLDQFKIVNDTVGHAAGDELLKQVAGMLGGLFRQRDTLARLGGDEFGLLLENCQLDRALVICGEILARLHNLPFIWEGNTFLVGVSIGVVPITAEKESVKQLLTQADVACYTAKDLGRNRVYVYQTEDSETSQRHGEIIQAAQMRDAVANDQLLLYCQPIEHLSEPGSAFKHYEVLIRMAKENNEVLLPNAFIPSAERYGLMTAIDRWVIRQTFHAMSTHDTEGLQVTVNLSGNSLDDDNLLEYVLEQQREFSISLEQICFEITETAAIHHIGKAQRFIRDFRELGGRIALDDFGSGFSSFRYLKTLPLDYIKIDGVFVSDMLSNPGDQAMVEAITQVAHTLGIQVIAEHATNQETINRLREIGVEKAQGYGIGRPIPMSAAWRKKTAPR